jgi:hypothetical protein
LAEKTHSHTSCIALKIKELQLFEITHTFESEPITKLNMKSILLFSLIVSFPLFSTITFSQTCSQEIAAFMAAPGGYDISGTGLLEADPEGTTLSFDNAFNTQSGPDLHVYLSINFESPTTPGNTNIDIAELTSNNGAQTYTIPSNVSLGDYNYVLIHCKSFNHWWGGGLLGEINCVSSTNAAAERLSPNVYPNPVLNEVTISLTGNDVEKITIIDVLGQVVSRQVVSGQNEMQIDISHLQTGLYVLTGINSNNKIVLNQKISKL